MSKRKLVLEVPPDCAFTDLELMAIHSAGWGIMGDKLVRRRDPVPIFGTREPQRKVSEGQMVVFVESVLDELHHYAWNLHVLTKDEYKEWASRE